jgi:ribose-phosphate pyrophosphokinase
MKNHAPIKFFAGRESRPLAEKIAESFGIPLGRTTVLEFSDGEIQPFYEESVSGMHSFYHPVDAPTC